MKYTVTIQAPGTEKAQAGADFDPEPVIEDLTEFRRAADTPWSNRWLGVVIALAVAIVGLGFTGHWMSVDLASSQVSQAKASVAPAPTATATVDNASFVLISPVDGSLLDGGVVEIRGASRRALGTVHVSVWLGDAVLGWTNLEIRAAEPVLATVRVFAPAVDLPVKLRIESAKSPAGPGVEILRDLRIRTTTTVGLWPVRVTTADASGTVVVDGFGPIASAVAIRITDADERVVALKTTTIGSEEGRPGAFGGRLIGLGSFSVRMSLHDRPPCDPLTLTVSWRDETTGALREIHQPILESARSGAGQKRRASLAPAEGPCRR